MRKYLKLASEAMAFPLTFQSLLKGNKGIVPVSIYRVAFCLASIFAPICCASSANAGASVSAGAYHVVAVKSNGEVWAWGGNSSNQLGGSVVGDQAIPIHVTISGTATAASAGGFHTLTLLSDGTVVAFGRNDEGQLGHGGASTAPGTVSGMTDVVAVAAGGYHSLALKADGTVVAWGANWNGQLGNGTLVSQNSAVQVTGLTDVIAIAAGTDSSYALKSDGTVVSWGANYSTQLGDGTGTDQTSPVPVSNLTDVTAIAAGWEHAVAIKSDGSVWGWGLGFHGQLGSGSIIFGSVSQPVQMLDINDAIAIAAGSTHTVVIRSDHSMWACGDNYTGQLGNGEVWSMALIPYIEPSMLTSGVVQVSAGAYTTFALHGDGTLSAFGYKELGQMGDGQTQGQPYPVQAYGQTDSKSVTAGAFHSVVLRLGGSVGWIGVYDTNSLNIGGLGPDNQSFQLKMQTGLTNVTQVASGDNYTLALLSSGETWAWGVGGDGELGDGNASTSMTPVQSIGLTDITFVAAGGSTSGAVKSDGSLWMWGINDFGQLGDGTTISRYLPAAVDGLTGITATAIGGSHVVALNDNGSVLVWGDNTDERILLGGSAIVSVPTAVPGLSQVIAIAAGDGFSLALKDDGSVVTWGINEYGQLGQGDYTLRSTPTIIPGLSNVVEISAGAYHGLARLQDGTLKSWGVNNFGQLGDGSFIWRPSPVAVNGLSDVRSIKAAYFHSLAVKNDGSTWSWGNNGNEQLGISISDEHRSVIRLIADSGDTNGNGIPDSWEVQYFGDLSHTGAEDSDGDGIPDIQEYLVGSNPTIADTDGDGLNDGSDPFPNDYYNGAIPTFEIVSGSSQHAPTSSLLEQPLVVRVKSSAGTPLANAPIVASLSLGSGRFGVNSQVLQTAPMSIRTDANGLASFIFETPETAGQSQLTISFTGVLPETPVIFDIHTDAIVASPILMPQPGGYIVNQVILVSCATPGATIRYTLDNREVVETDPEVANGDGFLLARGVYVKIRAWKDGFAPSPTVGGLYSVIGHVESGTDHQLVVRANGTVWAKGQNSRGQLGDGTTQPQTELRPVHGLTDVVAVAAGNEFSVALKNDGTLWAFGANDRGQLGDGSNIDRLTAVQIPGVNGVATVHVGDSFVIAMKWDAGIWTWGANDRGQLGDGTTTSRNTPAQVSGISSNATVSAGKNFALVMKNEGTVWGFGANDKGQLGDGTTVDRNTPVQVQGLSDIFALVGGKEHGLASKSDGTTWAWGANDFGQLGNGNMLGSTVPLQAQGPTNTQLVAAADNYSLTLSWDRQIKGWGDNQIGQLGASGGSTVPIPQEISDFGAMIFLEAGESGVLGVKPNGDVVAWGHGSNTIIGNLNDTDVDQDGLPDVLEIGWFGNIEQTGNEDFDGDGITNLQEYQAGSDLKDFYSRPDGVLAVAISKISGDAQTGPTSSYLALPFIVEVRDNLGALVVNAPVRFSVVTGGGKLASETGSFVIYDTVAVQTGANGQAKVFYQQGSISNTESRIQAEAGGNTMVEFTASTVIPVDTDGDGMPDDYEVENGLNPSKNDAFDSESRDRIPNIFKYKHGWIIGSPGRVHDPQNPVSNPPSIYTVDGALTVDDPNNNEYASIQGAIDAARESQIVNGQEVFPNRYAIIQVAAGIYEEQLDMGDVELLFLAELGYDGPVEIRANPSTPDYAIKIGAGVVMDGFVITHADESSGAGIYLADAGNGNHTRLVNCIIRDNSGVSNGAGIYNDGANLELVNSTLLRNSATSEGNGLYNASGTVNLVNSIVWNEAGQATTEIYPATSPEIMVSHSLIRGGQYEALNGNPLLTPEGYLKPGSPAIDTGKVVDASVDIHNEPRPTGSAPDIGADEFIDSDNDGLPDWLEAQGVTDPNADSNGNGMSDFYEWYMGLNPLVTGGSDDFDNDSVVNWEDARPANPSVGRLKVIISSPGDEAIIP